MQVFFIALTAELLKSDWDVLFSVSKMEKQSAKSFTGFDLISHEGSRLPAFDNPDKHPENSTPPAVAAAL